MQIDESQDTHSTIRNGQRMMWYTQRLWTLSANLPIKEVLIESIPEFTQNCWFQSRAPTPPEVAVHAKKIYDADLSYPVILNDLGGLMDGGHRLSKAYLLGQKTVKAVQFETLPEPDAILAGDFVDLVSDRMRLREFVAADVAALSELYQLKETSEFESWDPHSSIDETRGLLQFWIDESYLQPRRDYTLVIEVAGEMVGLCGLEVGFGTETDHDKTAFLGFRLHPKLWGQGYATEAATCLINYGFSKLGLHRIHSGCSAANFASARVLEKSGMQHEGTTRRSFPIGDTWTDYSLYGLLAKEHKSQHEN